MRERNYLFNDGDLRATLERHRKQVEIEINSQDKNYILNADLEELCDHFESKFCLHIPELKEDEIYISDEREADIDVSQDPMRMISDRSRPAYIKGMSVTFSIPYEGEEAFFKLQPSKFNYNPPVADVDSHTSELKVTYQTANQDGERMRADFQRTVKSIQEYLSWQKSEVSNFNKALRETAKRHIEFRKDKILKDQGMVASLGYPMKKRDDAPKTYRAPEVRQKPKIKSPPPATTKPFKPEPTLDLSEYENILEIISNMVFVIERSPKSFKKMGEEQLRDHFLLQLNGQYEGQATGETFNYEGKTDIIIKQDGQNLFVGECKFWTGPKGLLDTVDQLLGYVTWRDTKTAILLFCKNKDFSSVLSKLAETMKEHPNFKREENYPMETGFRYIFQNRDDTDREFYLTVLAFNTPS